LVFEFTAKYSLLLCGFITACINLKRIRMEELSLEDSRALLGVPDTKLLEINPTRMVFALGSGQPSMTAAAPDEFTPGEYRNYLTDAGHAVPK
jgi:hypothetical protein